MKIPNKKLLFVALIIISVLALGLLIWSNWGRRRTAGVQILTDRGDYTNGGASKIKISNLLSKNICFSSCYPYFLEKKNWTWSAYNYQDCPDPDLAKPCIRPGESKTFETTLPEVKEGIHRFVIPVCEGCEEDEEFRETTRLYSSQFEIKEKGEIINE